MSPKREPVRRHRQPPAGSRSGWTAGLLILLLLTGGGVWVFTQHRPLWDHALARLGVHGSSASSDRSPGPVPAPPPAASASSMAEAGGCWSPPDLKGSELKAARQAPFATIEQFRNLGPAEAGRIYRVQARFLGYRPEPDQTYLLQLGSLVDSHRTLNARIPAGRCVSNQESAALFDELREDIDLRFGRATTHWAAPSEPVQVMVTGIAVADGGGVVLQPVLDFRVQ